MGQEQREAGEGDVGVERDLHRERAVRVGRGKTDVAGDQRFQAAAGVLQGQVQRDAQGGEQQDRPVPRGKRPVRWGVAAELVMV